MEKAQAVRPKRLGYLTICCRCDNSAFADCILAPGGSCVNPELRGGAPDRLAFVQMTDDDF